MPPTIRTPLRPPAMPAASEELSGNGNYDDRREIDPSKDDIILPKGMPLDWYAREAAHAAHSATRAALIAHESSREVHTKLIEHDAAVKVLGRKIEKMDERIEDIAVHLCIAPRAVAVEEAKAKTVPPMRDKLESISDLGYDEATIEHLIDKRIKKRERDAALEKDAHLTRIVKKHGLKALGAVVGSGLAALAAVLWGPLKTYFHKLFH